ncbi:hypothetical protein PBV87_15210 [Niameybacter massiliensis]|uniref:Phage tail tape measure protein n=1 Tax=Holtiella tumoricola TaxID=3018743 RepID=A0AA42DPH2_9FIRM|nr:hypothetical protein [Holtiella tumoricola]MDA3732824.1 hypothetical protein [Holtiella tumoricola]
MASSKQYQIAFALNSKLASGFNKSFNSATKSIQSLAKTAKAAMATTIGAIGAKNTVGVALTEAMNLEGFKMQLETATKSAQKAGEIMKWSIDLANRTPFETGSVVEASARLEAMGLSAQKYLPMIGDMAGATNKDLIQATEAIIDAQTGELERLKEFGIKKDDIVAYAYEKMNKTQVVNNKGQITNQAKFNEAMLALMDDKFKGGMEKQASTLKGIMSTISGVMKSGMATMVGVTSDGTIKQGSLMELLKDKAKTLGEAFVKWQQDGTFEKIGDQIDSGISKAINSFKYLKNWSLDTFNAMKAKVLEHGPLLERIAQFVDNIKVKFKDLKGGTSTLDWLKDTALPKVADGILFVLDQAIALYDFISTNWSTLKPIVVGLGTAFVGWKIGSLVVEFYKTAKAITVATIAQKKLTLAKVADKAETIYIKALYAGDFLKSLLMQGKAIAGNTLAWTINTAQLVAQKVGLVALKGIQLASQGVTMALTAAQWALNAAFIASPIGWVVLGIGALIGVGVLLWKNWDTIKVKAFELWEGIQSAFGGVGQWFSGLWEGVKSTFKGFVNFIIGGLNKIPESLNKLIGVGQSFGINIPNIPTIPMFAKGTMSTPKGSFIAGEKGPELISGAPGRRVFTNAQTKGILSKGNNESPKFVYSPNVMVKGDGISESKLAQILEAERRKFMAEVKAMLKGRDRLAYG